MARMIREFPPRPTKYPWPEWSNGGIWKVNAMREYEVTPETLRSNINAHASRKGLTAKVTIDGSSIVFQLLKKQSRGEQRSRKAERGEVRR